MTNSKLMQEVKINDENVEEVCTPIGKRRNSIQKLKIWTNNKSILNDN